MAKNHATDPPADEQPPVAPETRPHCGIIMPMGDTDGYPPGHWGQVQRLIARAADKAGFTASIVGASLPSDMIQANIVRGIYENPVVVCDVSSLNPNVMLELGLRMATLLPLVLVFDNESKYPFDINSILHVRYPKGLHIFQMEAFVVELAEKIRQVDEAQKTNGYQPFLSHFKEVKIEPANLGDTSQNVTQALETLVSEMSSIKDDIKNIRRLRPGIDLKSDSLESVREPERYLLDLAVSELKVNTKMGFEDIKKFSDDFARDIAGRLYPEHGHDYVSRRQAITMRAQSMILNKLRSTPPETD